MIEIDRFLFFSFQRDHRRVASEKIREYFDEIQKNINESRKLFVDDPVDVQNEWNRIVIELDKWLERAIRYNFKTSLIELSKAINGDGKAGPGQIFKIEIVLEPKTVGDAALSRVRNENLNIFLFTRFSLDQFQTGFSHIERHCQ